MNNLDIDKLHYIVDQINNKVPSSRREGRTTAYLQLMLGEVWGGDIGNNYLYIGRSVHLVKRNFVTLLLNEGIPVSVIGKGVNIPTLDQFFMFIEPADNLNYEHLRGLRFHRAFVDLYSNYYIEDQLHCNHILNYSGDII